MERLTRNSALCLVCNEEIVSTHRHDFKKCSCGNVGVDGGLAYQRRLFGGGPWRDTSVWEDHSQEQSRIAELEDALKQLEPRRRMA